MEQHKKEASSEPMSTSMQLADPRVLVSLPLRVLTMQGVLSSNSMATTGKDERSKFEKIDTPTLAADSKVAKAVLVEVLGQEVVMVVVAMVGEEDLVVGEGLAVEVATVEGSEAEVDSRVVGVSVVKAEATEVRLRRPLLPIPSPTSPRVVVNVVK